MSSALYTTLQAHGDHLCKQVHRPAPIVALITACKHIICGDN